jgi:hypothetical protein
MNAREILVEARELISDPSKWTVQTFARRATGDEVVATDSKAERFCALGAIFRVSEVTSPGQLRCIPSGMTARLVLMQAAYRLHGKGITEANDFIGHHAVLEMFDTAIASLPEPSLLPLEEPEPEPVKEPERELVLV